jgi:hypothetical protein
MIFPTVHHYMSRMGLGMTSTMPHVPPVHGSLPMPRLPFLNQSIASVSPAVNQAPLYVSPTLAPPGFASMLGVNPMQLPHSQVDIEISLELYTWYQKRPWSNMVPHLVFQTHCCCICTWLLFHVGKCTKLLNFQHAYIGSFLVVHGATKKNR